MIRRRIRPGFRDPWRTIIGVVGEVKNAGLDKGTGTELYLPYRQLTPGLQLGLAGAVLGAAGGAALTRLMRGLLFGVSALDPATFVAVALAMVGVTLAACYLPARRVARVGPMVALGYG